ncbi:MAG TPA: hypothetical protein DDW49_04840 [Deltaproteobacteria bacterium]|nr:MAG: hypothetical protein A2048_03730 [Deltaproteobacteria bacterium GWA2_45_12]HBF12704.1 hypothetical protein [Deltaproteobacteria bacterium]
MKYRVDTIPYWLKPFFWIYGYGLGFLCFIGFCLLHGTCRFQFKNVPPNNNNYIYCIWHDALIPYCITFLRHQRHVWINHPAWYMKPIHVLLKLQRIHKLCLGSTGNDGKEAADEIVDYLKKGYSTVMATDGPYGPPKVLKKGALHMAIQSGVPIVPVQFVTSKTYFFKKSWDGKRIPLPFSTIRVIYGHPINVTKKNFDESYQKIQNALS